MKKDNIHTTYTIFCFNKRLNSFLLYTVAVSDEINTLERLKSSIFLVHTLAETDIEMAHNCIVTDCENKHRVLHAVAQDELFCTLYIF